MTAWLVALAAGIAVGVAQYGWWAPRASLASLPAALLRSAAVALIVALLLDAPAGRARRRPPVVAIDASESWGRGGRDDWRAALDSARRAGGDSVLLFGDSLRARPSLPDASSVPADHGSRVGPAVERATAAGRAIVVVTDGELDDPAALEALPPGSRVVALTGARGRDGALASLEIPRAAVAGDSLDVRVTIAAGAAGSGAGELALLAGDRPLATARIAAGAPWSERDVALRALAPAGDGPVLLRAALRSEGDTEARNDTLVAVLEVTRAAAAVFVSTRPDFDAREALAVLRGTLSVPVRAYWRVAPGAWRVDGALTPVTETEVRRALREAPVAVVHGDTAALGAPRAASVGALALIAPPIEDTGEWYASGAPSSPLVGALSGLPWDSLAPIQAGAPPRGDWTALEARLGRSGAPRALVAGTDGPRRVAVVAASGFARWRLRGGASADAFTALWGALFDWLLAGRRDPRPVVPDAIAFREGEPVRWRRGATSDSVLRVVLTPRGRQEGAARVDTVTLRFAGDDNVASSAALAAGVYEVASGTGRALLAVNRSREWVPRRPQASSRSVRGTPPAERAPGLRRYGWAYAAAVLALCAEWLLRRRVGLR